MLTKLLIEDLTKAYENTLKEDHCGEGLLNLDYDDRADIIADHIKPTLPGYSAYEACFDGDGLVTEEDEADIVIPFEEKAQQAFDAVEREFCALIVTLLKNNC